MSKRKQRRWPRVLQGLVGYLLTLILALMLTGGCVLSLMQRLLTDQALHGRVAADDRVIDLQMARMDGEICDLAEEYSFAPETVLNLVTRDGVRAYGQEIVAWWMGLMGQQPVLTAPMPDTDEIAEAVREDALFQEHTESYLRRVIAQDSVAYPVGKALQGTVLPIRVSVVAVAMPEVMERVSLPALMEQLALAVKALFGASAVLLLLVLASQGRNRFVFASAGLLAADALLAAMTVAVRAADLPGALSALSAALGLQAGILMEVLTPSVLLAEGGLLLAGVVLLALGLLTARRAHRQTAGASA